MARPVSYTTKAAGGLIDAAHINLLQTDVALIDTALAVVEGAVHNVKAPVYGAVGNGVADDTAAINAASLAASVAGGIVYFPPGTYLVSPTTTAGLNVYSNITYMGVGPASIIKVKANAGNYLSVFMPPVLATRVEHVTFRDLRINQNAAAQTNATTPMVAGGYQIGIYATNYKYVNILNVGFDCCGVNTVLLNGDGYADAGDYLVDGCAFRWAKLPNATNPDAAVHRSYDNSAGYTVGRRGLVTRCTFISTPSAGPRGAWEIHGPHQSFVGNLVDGYQTLLNVGTGTVTYPVVDTMVSDNVGRNLTTGIRIIGSGTAATKRLTVTDNLLHMDTAAHGLNEGWGIVTATSSGSEAAEEIDISRNAIVYELDARSTTWTGAALGISEYFAGITIWTYGSIKGLRVEDNTIVNPGCVGIAVGQYSPATTTVVTDGSVRRNKVRNAGRIGTWAGGGRYIDLAGSFLNLDVSDNDLTDEIAMIGTRRWLYAPTARLGTATNAWVYDNRLTLTSTATGTFASVDIDWAKLSRKDVRMDWDPGIIAALAAASTTFVLTGAVAGDTVEAHPFAAVEPGLSYTAFVNAPNQGGVILNNGSAGAIDPAIRTWRFRLRRTQQDV